ncbi:MAG: hypothetical protein LAP85_10550 [Acidobacteriia bacterium]|nr:hypothetical protein [Terriglobia bacterium]
MIDSHDLPTWDSIFHGEGLKSLRRGRGACPFCDSSTGFSCHDEKGFNCFACAEHGDKIAFVQKLRGCDFVSALKYFGLEPGKPPAPDPEILRRRAIKEGLQTWARELGRELRDEYLGRFGLEAAALQRLHRDAQDERAWTWLAAAYRGLDQVEYLLDQIDIGTESQQINAYREWRAAA